MVWLFEVSLLEAVASQVSPFTDTGGTLSEEAVAATEQVLTGELEALELDSVALAAGTGDAEVELAELSSILLQGLLLVEEATSVSQEFPRFDSRLCAKRKFSWSRLVEAVRQTFAVLLNDDVQLWSEAPLGEKHILLISSKLDIIHSEFLRQDIDI